MAPVYTPNTVRACMLYSLNGEQACNIFHFDLGEEPTTALLTQVAEMLFDWYSAEVRPLQHAGTILGAIEVRDISGPDEDGIVYTFGLPLAGTSGASSLPNNATVAIKNATGLTGRSRRGRNYFIGLGTTQLQTGSQLLTSTFQIALQDAWQALVDAAVTAGFEWVVNSTISGGVPRVTGVNTPVTSVQVEGTVDSQRRRLPGRGD